MFNDIAVPFCRKRSNCTDEINVFLNLSCKNASLKYPNGNLFLYYHFIYCLWAPFLKEFSRNDPFHPSLSVGYSPLLEASSLLRFCPWIVKGKIKNSGHVFCCPLLNDESASTQRKVKTRLPSALKHISLINLTYFHNFPSL